MRNIIAALLLAAAPAAQAAESCTVPNGLQPAPVTLQEPTRILPVTSLVLAYYWWPQQCQRPDSATEPSCKAHFGFKVHGLWPDAANRTYPQFCRPPTPLTPATLHANYCMTPSATLLQHEWAKHGTCHWSSQADYFASARRVAATIQMPLADKLPTNGLSAGALRTAIIAANPSLPRASLFVGTDRKQWLTEARVCLTLDYSPTACETGNIGAPDNVPIRIRPRG